MFSQLVQIFKMRSSDLFILGDWSPQGKEIQ